MKIANKPLVVASLGAAFELEDQVAKNDSSAPLQRTIERSESDCRPSDVNRMAVDESIRTVHNMRPGENASVAVISAHQLKDQGKPSSSSSQVRALQRSLNRSESEIKSKDVKGNSVEESLRMVVFLGSWGPN
ncbi:uncharacterized protein A4U43_C03F8500 [Asparagus officinalis]|uniref:Uncharacterized protein n=1 Tax=Asparagus officinalis TaxID=4686 RepID=A0A5P1FA83_ASPOF|nr:uncharacterized protein A4U43_C03F8500 [Asparagus officinalis]